MIALSFNNFRRGVCCDVDALWVSSRRGFVGSVLVVVECPSLFSSFFTFFPSLFLDECPGQIFVPAASTLEGNAETSDHQSISARPGSLATLSED